MGAAYSVKGFINAALRRGGKTLLVEGVSDRGVILRMCADLEEAAPFVVDQAGILDEPRLRGLGNRERVKEVLMVSRQLSEQVPQIADALAVLLDREWEGLGQGELRFTEEWTSPCQESTNFLTLGHSIENYNFRSDHVISYLKMVFSEHLKPGFYAVVTEEFPKFLVVAACISFALEERGFLGRATGVMRCEYILPGDKYISVTCALGQALNDRGCDAVESAEVVTRVNSLCSDHADQLIAKDSLQWLPRGHVGEETIWACVGMYAKMAGVAENVCDKIVGFGKKERQRYMTNLIADADRQDVHPLGEVVSWLTA